MSNTGSPLSNNVGRNVHTLRVMCGLSLRELAERLDAHGQRIVASGILKLEKGTRRVTVDELYAFAEIFKVPVDSLVKGPSCGACNDAPPPGFACNTCHAVNTGEAAA